MPRTLAATVSLFDPEAGRTVSFVAGDVPPEWAAALITNQAAWAQDVEPESAEPPNGADAEPKPLHRRTKDDLIVLAAEHDVPLEPDATKAQILEALQDAHIEA